MDAIVPAHYTFWIELVAAFLGVLGVWDLGSGKKRGYISGFVSTTTYIVLCATKGIYADAVINGWYSVMSVVGWYSWSKRQVLAGEIVGIPRQSMDWRALRVGIVIGVGSWILFVVILCYGTDSRIVVWDATTSAMAVTAMLWMASGYVWNWPLWLIINALSVGLYLHKEMIPTAVQYFVFGVLAIRGWYIWTRKYEE